MHTSCHYYSQSPGALSDQATTETGSNAAQDDASSSAGGDLDDDDDIDVANCADPEKLKAFNVGDIKFYT